MTRFASKFGIAAALTLVAVSVAAAQGSVSPTTRSTVSKGEVVPPKVDTVTVTRVDTVRLFSKPDTITVTGPTVTRYDTTTVEVVPGFLGLGNGLYFGLGAGSYYPSAALGAGQIPGYAFQANLGVDPAGSPFGFRVTTQLARPDESQTYGAGRARPSIWNTTADLKLRLPFFSRTRLPMLGAYAVAGGAYVRAQDVVYETEEIDDNTPNPAGPTILEKGWHDSWGYNWGGGLTLNMGHKRQLFVEARMINYNPGDRSLYEVAHQLPLILGINWY
jgi:hypothetical protein